VAGKKVAGPLVASIEVSGIAAEKPPHHLGEGLIAYLFRQ
jgi:hypothetical protein